MKKIFYVLSITFLILQACSSGDSSGDSSDSSNQTTLLKKLISQDNQLILHIKAANYQKLNIHKGIIHII